MTWTGARAQTKKEEGDSAFEGLATDLHAEKKVSPRMVAKGTEEEWNPSQKAKHGAFASLFKGGKATEAKANRPAFVLFVQKKSDPAEAGDPVSLRALWGRPRFPWRHFGLRSASIL